MHSMPIVAQGGRHHSIHLPRTDAADQRQHPRVYRQEPECLDLPGAVQPRKRMATRVLFLGDRVPAAGL